MKTYTSKIYIRPNTLADERVCVGLFAFSEDKSYFEFSERKLKWLKPELGPEVTKNLIHSLENIRIEIKRIDKADLFYHEESRRMFGEGAFKYLNVYGAGLMHFEKLSPNALDLNEEVFIRLFRRFVDSKPVAEKRIKSSFKSSFKALIKRPEFKVLDLDYSLSPSIVEGIYTDHKVDFIGKNGAILAGTAIDFNTEAPNIERKLFEFTAISRGLNVFSSSKRMKHGKYFCFFNIPESKEAKAILDLAFNNSNKPFELKELDYLETLSPEIEKHAYSKFSEFLESAD